MKAGVMEIVGETILDYMMQTGGTEKRITALGVASWGFVANKKALVSPDVSSTLQRFRPFFVNCVVSPKYFQANHFLNW